VNDRTRRRGAPRLRHGEGKRRADPRRGGWPEYPACRGCTGALAPAGDWPITTPLLWPGPL